MKRRGSLIRFSSAFAIGLLLLALAPPTSAHTFVAPWTMPWHNTSGWAPCAGSNTINAVDPNPTDGVITMYANTLSSVNPWNPFCGANSGDITIYEGLHGGYFTATQTTYKFSYALNGQIYFIVSCLEWGVNPFAAATAFFALWDNTAGVNVIPNTYAITLEVQASCNGGSGTWTYPFCIWDQTVSTPVQLTVGHSYQPRVGMKIETNTQGANNQLDYPAQAVVDLWNYDKYCQNSQNLEVLMYMDFTPSGGDSPMLFSASNNSQS